MKNINLYILPIIIGALLFTACTDETAFNGIDDNTAHGRETVVGLTLNTISLHGELDSRSIPDGYVDEGLSDENPVWDLWLIEYDQNNKMIGAPHYYDDPNNMSAVNIIVPEGNEEYSIVAIANTGDKSLDNILKTATDKSNLINLSYPISSPEETYVIHKNSDGTDLPVLMMNGQAKVSKNTTGIEIPMYRNVAKLSVGITNKANSGVTVKSIKLCSIPSRISYADQLVETNASNGTVYFNFDLEEWDCSETDPGEDRHMDLLYYLPRNMKGGSESTLAYNKNKYAPLDATYLEIMCNDSDDGSTIRYRFYLGKNMKNDFNIEPNHYYNLNIDITGKGDPEYDSRVEVFKKGMCASSNSYVVSYLKGIDNPYYSIPLDRINYFWKNTDDRDPNFLIQTGTHWVAEVIWQDSDADLFHFCNPDGSEKESLQHFYEGTDKDEFFTIKPTGLGTGNVLIGVRNKDLDGETDGYMWSWHLWVTEYDPEYKGHVSDNVYSYKVSDGYVHRYDTDVWHNELPALNGYYIMDRNFGAKMSYDKLLISSGVNDIVGVHFYFGRKDPFVRKNIALYKYSIETDGSTGVLLEKQLTDIYGTNFIKRSNTKTSSLEYTVKHPNHDYTMQKTGDGSGWADNVKYCPLTWLRLDWDTAYKKSLFDPSPEGWMLLKPNQGPTIDLISSLLSIGDNWIPFLLTPREEATSNNIVYYPRGGAVNAGNSSGGNECWYMTNGTITLNYRAPFFYASYNKNSGLITVKDNATERHWGGPTRLVRDPSKD